jgi:hypothetical protein
MVLVVGLALLHVNTAKTAWYPAAATAWDGEHYDNRGNSLGWPITYECALPGGLEQRPSAWWLDMPSTTSRVTVFVGPLHLTVNVLLGGVILFAVWRASAPTVEAVRKGQIPLPTAYVLIGVAAALVFLEVKCRRVDQPFYDARVPYLTWSSLHHWFGRKSLLDWLRLCPLVVRVPILLGWLSAVAVVYSSLISLARRLTTRSAAATSVVIVICIWAAAALIHAQFEERFVSHYSYDGYGSLFGSGWPLISTLVHGDDDGISRSSRSFDAGSFFVNLGVCLALAGITMGGVVSLCRATQRLCCFRLSDMFLGVTALSIVVFLFVWDRNSPSLAFEYPSEPAFGGYLTLATLPIDDQLAIWFCILCTVVLALKLVQWIACRYRPSRSVP